MNLKRDSTPKNVLSAFTQYKVAQNLYEFFSSVEHKSRYFEECVRLFLCLEVQSCPDPNILVFCSKKKKRRKKRFKKKNKKI